MSVYPCSYCGQKSPGRLASIYSAWFLADGTRTAWKQRGCVRCVVSRFQTLLAHSTDDSYAMTMCPACGMNSHEDLDPIYVSVYLPKQEPREYQLTTDSACAARLRLTLQDRAERLPDRLDRSLNGAANEPDPWLTVLA